MRRITLLKIIAFGLTTLATVSWFAVIVLYPRMMIIAGLPITDEFLPLAITLSAASGLAWVMVWLEADHAERGTRCRRCGHILRGLTEPRCPECGERI